MFYSYNILCLQKGGKFAKVWIAATCGTGTFSRKEVLEIDLEKLGEDIRSYITSRSAKPRDRFSLVLSSKLIHGLAKMYQRKATIILDEVISFLCKIHKPDMFFYKNSSTDLEVSNGKQKPKRKTKRKMPESGTPVEVGVKITPPEEQEVAEKEISNEALQSQLSQHRAHEEMITLREEMPQTVQDHIEQEDMFRFGDVAEVEAVERALSGTAEPIPLPPLEQIAEPSPAKTIRVQAEVHAPLRGKDADKRVEEAEETSPRKRRRTRGTEKEAEAKVVEPPEEVVTEEREQEPAVVAVEEQIGSERSAVQKEVAPEGIRDKRVPATHNKVQIHKEVYNAGALVRDFGDRPLLLREMKEYFIFPPSCIISPDHERTHVMKTLDNVYADQDTENVLAEVALDTKSRDSLATIRSFRERSSSFQDVRVQQIPQVIPSEVQLIPMETPRPSIQEEQSILMNPIIEETLPPAGFINGNKEAIIEILAAGNVKQKKSKPSKDRIIEAIKAILRKWNWTNGFPTIEDVCPKPVNRLNISQTFHDLLVLHKNHYVSLVEDPDTLELKHIEMGIQFE